MVPLMKGFDSEVFDSQAVLLASLVTACEAKGNQG